MSECFILMQRNFLKKNFSVPFFGPKICFNLISRIGSCVGGVVVVVVVVAVEELLDFEVPPPILFFLLCLFVVCWIGLEVCRSLS